MTVRRKILLPVLVLLALTLIGLGVLVIVYANNSLAEQEASTLDILTKGFQESLDTQRLLALSLATQLADNPEIQAAFAAQDRERLIELGLPAYKQLAEKYGISQAQFHLPPATSFLRYHQLDRYGDDLSSFRFTVLAANAQKVPVGGLEIGRGGLGVRGVVPVEYRGQHLGTVEYGLDPAAALLNELKAKYGVDWQLLLNRAPAEIATFQPITSTVAVPSPDLLLQYTTRAQPLFSAAEVYQRVLAGGAAELYRAPSGGREYAIYTAPLVDYSGKVIGVVEVISDRTAALQANTSRALTALVLLALLLLVGSGVVAVVVTRVVKPIRDLTEAAAAIERGDLNRTAPTDSRDEIGELGQAFNNMTAELRNLIDQLETRVEVRTAQLQASADVGRAATSILNTDDLLAQIVKLIVERFGFYYAAIFTIDDLGRYAVLREAKGPGDAAWVLKQSGHKLEIGGQSMVSTAILTRRSRIALDVGDEPTRFANPLLPDTRSEIALPLQVGARIIGVLDVQSTLPAAFDQANAIVLQAMADQIAVALNNAGQYQREQRRAEQTTGLLEASLELSAQPDRDKLSDRIVQLAMTLLNADGAGLWFPIADQQIELQYTQNVNGQALTGRRLRVGEGLSGQVFASGLTLRVDDYLTWSGRADVFADAPFHAALAVPLIWQGQIVGALAVTRSQRGQPFGAEDEGFAQLLATQSAAALENLRLRDEQQQALEQFNIINRRLTQDAWRSDQLGEVTVYEHRQHVRDPQPPSLSVRFPIELRGEAIGALTIEDTRRQALTEDEQGLVQGVVQQMSLALENQRLADIAQQAARRDRAIAETADKIHQPTSLDAIMRVAVEELTRVMGVDGVGVQLGFAPPANGNGHSAGQESEL